MKVLALLLSAHSTGKSCSCAIGCLIYTSCLSGSWAPDISLFYLGRGERGHPQGNWTFFKVSISQLSHPWVSIICQNSTPEGQKHCLISTNLGAHITELQPVTMKVSWCKMLPPTLSNLFAVNKFYVGFIFKFLVHSWRVKCHVNVLSRTKTFLPSSNWTSSKGKRRNYSSE